MNLWTNEKRKVASELITYLLSKYTGRGWISNKTSHFAFCELSFSISKRWQTKRMVMHVLEEMIKNSQTTVEEFEEIYFKINQNIKKNHELWEIFIPANFCLDFNYTNQPQLKVIGKKYQIIKLSTVKRRLKENIIDKQLPLFLKARRKEVKIPSLFFYVTSEGEIDEVAWKSIEPSFDTIRGLLEFLFGYHSVRFSNFESPRRKVSHPEWIIVQSNKSKTHFLSFETESEVTSKTFSFNKDRYKKFRDSLRIFINEPQNDTTLSLITNCLRIYSQAMDAKFSYSCFLGLWQLCEAITLSENFGGKTEIVTKRIAWHSKKLNLIGSGFSESLEYFKNKRHSVVHEGILDIIEEDVNTIKIICETALLWLFKNRKSIPTIRHLENYYRLKDRNISDLKCLEESIKRVNKIR